ncbi:hypothetical protein [Kitasatospora sp. NPDC006786]|uniref:hypothetical protein n=1 Tax=unclassified Kitasatospora TaxID=2633591 RepID=UPI0033C26CE0
MSVVGAALLLASWPTSAPASASTRSSDACTHNWSGPKVCISIVGHDHFARSLRAVWKNPPGDVRQSRAIVHEGPEQREVHVRVMGRRSGDEVVAEWRDLELADGRVCVSFADTAGVWACQDSYATGRGD